MTGKNKDVNLNLYTLVATNMSDIIRLSISEDRLFGVNSPNHSPRYQPKIAYAIVHNRYQLNFESVLKWSQRRVTVKKKLANKGIGQWISGNQNPLYSPNRLSTPLRHLPSKHFSCPLLIKYPWWKTKYQTIGGDVRK